MIEKNRGNEVILEMVEALKNKNFEFPRAHIIIYKVILAYSLSSTLTTVIDFLIFTFATLEGYGIWISTAMARTIVASANFLLNKKEVFKSRGNGGRQFIKYALPVVASGMLSALSISLLKNVISANLIIVKAIVETCLFFFNYYVQRTFIFVKRKGDEMENPLLSDEIIERTDWTKYYEGKKSWISSFTQRYTLEQILGTINDYVHTESDIRICEIGGGNSCFAAKICEKEDVWERIVQI